MKKKEQELKTVSINYISSQSITFDYTSEKEEKQNSR
jgi:hypothetical protein